MTLDRQNPTDIAFRGNCGLYSSKWCFEVRLEKNSRSLVLESTREGLGPKLHIGTDTLTVFQHPLIFFHHENNRKNKIKEEKK